MLGIFINRNRKKVKKILDEGCLILDVRSESEFRGAHIKNSTNIPLNSLPRFMGELDKTRPILTCSATGKRSIVAKRMLIIQGFNAVNGGNWKNIQKYKK